MKRIHALTALILSVCLVMSGCSDHASGDETVSSKKAVTLEVSTMYAGEDQYSQLFVTAVENWQAETGNTVNSVTSTADEAYKSRIQMEFQTGAEPDVLFYFNGVDSNSLVSNKRVVSLDEIREVYPEYATNMKEGMMKASPYDGKIYCIPVNGYWEALFVNLKALDAAGVEMPDADTSWEEFKVICTKIREAGITPIAVSLSKVPHYWFEYCIYNFQTPDNHAIVPEFLVDNMGQAWVAGLNDLKDMYDREFFPYNTLYMSDEAAKKLFLDGDAAFLLDGSWYVSEISGREDSSDFAVTYVPGTETRKTTDIISGLSTGYYITRKAWDDPAKRDAAVSFVEYMTTDELVIQFAEISATALINTNATDDGEESSFISSAKAMVAGATGYSEAVQDYVPTNCRTPIFDNMKDLMEGKTDISEAVKEVISLKKKRDK